MPHLARPTALPLPLGFAGDAEFRIEEHPDNPDNRILTNRFSDRDNAESLCSDRFCDRRDLSTGRRNLNSDLSDLSCDLSDLSRNHPDLSCDPPDLSRDLSDVGRDHSDPSRDHSDLSCNRSDLSRALFDLSSHNRQVFRHRPNNCRENAEIGSSPFDLSLNA